MKRPFHPSSLLLPPSGSAMSWRSDAASVVEPDEPPHAPLMSAEIEDTYAEAFRSIYAEVLITARDRKWLDHAVHAATGHASSSILCDCEAGASRYVGPGGDESFQT